MMDYWGGSRPGTARCNCGMQADCIDPRKWCNCDSRSSEWKMDEGYLREKEHLPVAQLRFGDTGSLTDDKKGEFTLGPLICEEDSQWFILMSFRIHCNKTLGNGCSDACITLELVEKFKHLGL